MISSTLIDEIDVTMEVEELADDVTLGGARAHREQDDSSTARMSHKKPTTETHGGGDGGAGGGSGGGGGGNDKDDDHKGFFEWLEGAAEDAVEFVEDVVEEVVEVVEDVAEEVAEEVGHVVGEALDAANAALTVIGEAASDAAEAVFGVAEDVWNSTIGPAVDAALEGLEDAGVFDFIDTVTLGGIDISYDGGDLHVDLGIDGVISVGLDVGEDGVFAEGSVIAVGEGHMGLGSDGSLSMGAGVDYGPLGSWNMDAGVDGDGDVSLSAEGELHVPDPTGGTIDLEGRGGWQQDGEGYTVEGEYSVGHTTATGQHVGGGHHVRIEDDGSDNGTTTIGAHQVVGQKGLGEVRTEENVTIYAEDGEITGTEGEAVLKIDTVFGDREESITVWDTQHDGKDDESGAGGKGDGGNQNNGNTGNNGAGDNDMPKDDDLTLPRRLRQAQHHQPVEDIELEEVEAVTGFGDSPGLQGGDMVQAQGMVSDTLDKMMEEFAEHVQPKINDGIDEAMDMVFGEDGTDGNGGTDDDAGSGDESGSGEGDSGGGDESGGGGETQGLATGKRVHKPVIAREGEGQIETWGDAAVESASDALITEVGFPAVAPHEGPVWEDDSIDPAFSLQDDAMEGNL